MAQYVDYGYGVNVFNLKIKDIGKLKKLIALAPKFEANAKGLMDILETHNADIDEYIDKFSEYTSRRGYGIASILAEVIEEAEGVSLQATDDCTGRIYLLYEPDFPWNFKKKNEQDFTPETIESVMNKYISIISDSHLNCEYITVYN